MTNSKKEETCSQSINSVINREWDKWNGLSKICSHKTIKEILEGGDVLSIGSLSNKTTDFRLYEHEDFSKIIAWFNEDETILISFEGPLEHYKLDKIIEVFGIPEKKFEPDVDFIPYATQLIYASKGITFFYKEHNRKIVKIAIYPPTTVDFYFNNLGATDRKRYFPRKNG
ncbi:MAG TPA: hypothetical protein VKX40_11255 [Aequorivita sp.]|nr:hypothetical protein [Aequorivita sp.]